MTIKEKTKSFLEIAPQFKLGHLVTESFHPKTRNLSALVKADVEAAHRLLQEVDADALSLLREKKKDIWAMAREIRQTLQAGNRVYMCGCGATGRLSLVLETLYRQKFGATEEVFSFMAGGDFALIKSVESFEDRVDYGERQLRDLGFGPSDLLLASTEGGETPFVIGAANAAAELSGRPPYFLYCNPDDKLRPIERSREVIENPKIKKVNLTVGPMAISGSTRMQASTVLMLAIGVGLLHVHGSEEEFGRFYEGLLGKLTSLPYAKMAPLTSLEARLYQEGKYLNYLADPSLAISILTDTTERSPTFSLRGFENHLEPASERSLSYLFIPGEETSAHAWRELLKRSPRALGWTELAGKIDLEKVLGFDISSGGWLSRRSLVQCESFAITKRYGEVLFQCLEAEVRYELGEDPLFNHLAVKMLLNAHSTLIMGILGRYEGNVMTYVRPSNNKLIDRAARYVLKLSEERGRKPSYEAVVEMIFEEMEKEDARPVVLRVMDRSK